MIKRAVIFAGGKGKRLRPYTHVVPKPLMPIGKKPILELIIEQLVKAGIKHITISVFENINLFKSILRNKKFPKIKIDFLIEKKSLSTAGGLKIIKNLPKEFFAMNGDLITNLNFKNFYNFHKKYNSDLTLCSKTLYSKIEYGVVENDKHLKLLKFTEKPKIKYKVNLGIYIIKRDVIKLIPRNKSFGFDKLIKKIPRKKISVYNSNCKWFDIGREKDLFNAHNFILKNKK